MKIIAFLILISNLLYADVILNVKERFKKNVTVNDSVEMIVNELSPLIDSPINWCTIEPTGKFEVYATDDDAVSDLVIEAELSCNENMAYAFYSNIITRYKNFLLEYDHLVAQAISDKYPDLSFIAEMHNLSFTSWLRYKPTYGGNFVGNNKIKFFRLVLNDKFISPELKKFQSAGLLVSYPYDTQTPFKEKKDFTFKVYTKTLKKDIKIRLEPVYHPSAKEGNEASKQ